jgi:large subunit ribosomal protein L15
MKPHEIAAAGPNHKRRRRLGRGEGSGLGKTGGRGTLGQRARSGKGVAYPGFEGGQTRLLMRFPRRRGFSNARFKRVYQIFNVEALEVFADGTIVGPEELIKEGIIEAGMFKVLGNGDLTRKLVVRAPMFSQSAKSKIEAAGGTVEELIG